MVWGVGLIQLPDAPPTLTTEVAVIQDEPFCVMALELLEFAMMPHAKLTWALPDILMAPASVGLSAQMQAPAVPEPATARPVTVVWPSQTMAERNEGIGRLTMTSTALATPVYEPLSGGLLIVMVSSALL